MKSEFDRESRTIVAESDGNSEQVERAEIVSSNWMRKVKRAKVKLGRRAFCYE
jgi:hypothetical protein